MHNNSGYKLGSCKTAQHSCSSKEEDTVSRSRRKLPILGITKKETEQQYKRTSNRAERRKAHILLATEQTEQVELLSPKLFGDPWNGPKDGKRWWSAMTPQYWRK